jgi:hypothetical protein
MARKKIVGIHLLVGSREPTRPFGDAKCQNENQSLILVEDPALITCPWCLGARNKEHARRMIARMYAKLMEEDERG